jgi:hypothetical protein
MSFANHLQSGYEYFTNLVQTPSRIGDERAQARRRQQQQEFIDLAGRLQQQEQDIVARGERLRSQAIGQQAPAVAAARMQEKAGEVNNQIQLENNRAGLTNQVTAAAGQTRQGVIGAQAGGDVLRTHAAFDGAGKLAVTQGGVDRSLQGDRLNATMGLVNSSQAFETGMADRFIGATPALEQVIAASAADRDGRHGLIRELAQMSRPTGIDRALQLLGPTALLVASLAK